MSFFVYILECSDPSGSVYVGATVNLDQRLRRHNKEIVGGATRTGKKVVDGYKWTRIGHVCGFPTWNEALKFEWRWHHMARRCYGTPLKRNIEALQRVLALDRPTAPAMRYVDWPNGTGPIVNMETDDSINIWKLQTLIIVDDLPQKKIIRKKKKK
jgi:predicted GIY-YIG superfamily endonuclease